MRFIEKLQRKAAENKSWLCVGLDPDPERLPSPLRGRDLRAAIYEFLTRIIEATSDLVCAYKPNIAFYEALGTGFLELLSEVRERIPADIPIILDAKRGDIASSSEKYAVAAFDVFGCDAVTVSPYLGYDSIEPFLRYSDRGVFLLCRTSNPGARDLQDLVCEGRPLYEVVVERAKAWHARGEGELGLVVGATYPEELECVRSIVGDEMALLVPGVGTQGGDLAEAVRAAANSHGENAIITVSRGVLYASDGDDYAEAARREAERLREEIQSALALSNDETQ
jgi:orotidine-5'-phosphate decarboxylase